jgi:SNF2 family DNA or RNA helicase
MVRHRHQEVGLSLPAREVTLLPIELTSAERTLYERLSQHLRAVYAERLAGHGNLLPILTIQRELCSSPQALAATLAGTDWLGGAQGDLLALARAVALPAKARALANLLQYLEAPALVFTEFRATQDMLVAHLNAGGIPAAAFAGHHTPPERERRLTWFQHTPRGVLVSTEAGSQGLNLQWCHRVVNYDLPWNPMRIEQRIGRVHRLGQSSVCHIYNLFAAQTIEEQILHLLHEKIDLFREVVGELDVILRHLEHRGRSLEGRLLAIAMTADTPDEVEARLDRVAHEFRAAQARVQWLDPPGLGRF